MIILYSKDMHLLMQLRDQEEREAGELSSSTDNEDDDVIVTKDAQKTNEEPPKKRSRRDDDDCIIVHVDKAIDDKLRSERRIREIVELIRMRIRFYGRNARITDYFPKA